MGTSPLPVDEVGPGCEPLAEGFLREPVSTWSSLAFVLAGVVVVVMARRRRRALGAPVAGGIVEPPSTAYAVLVAGIGLGSVVQHGPNPAWADLAHDLPLLAALLLITADAVADLAGRAREWWWWVLPTVAIAPVIHLWPTAGDLTQGVVAAVTVIISLDRAWRRPALRRTILTSTALLATGGVIEILSSPGWPLCDPESQWWFGHAVWHVLIAAGLAVLAGALGWREAPGSPGAPPPRRGRTSAPRSHR
ncbi:hypothetical protein J4G33_09865 [Actinotalea sp. BY-33]|uniref:Ceramidase n=1 Tax=Actinotalea soli TaxID=2819234 RepID=A0A939RU26_9CELL|nr:hypothetical protein [Actinotalea soli]MBO1752109.1 hypothetical protein [Actinotalea soli]